MLVLEAKAKLVYSPPARDVEAVLGQQLVEVVAGDAPRDARKFRANEIAVAIADRLQSRVDLAAASAGADGG